MVSSTPGTEQVRQRIAREMVRVTQLDREDDPLRRDAGFLRQLLQAVLGGLRPIEQPEHAVGHLVQDLHPTRPGVARNLMQPVEAAVDERVFRQAGVGAGMAALGDFALAVVGLVARQAQHLLRVEQLVRGRDDEIVGDDVVVIGGTERAGIAQPIDDDRRRAHRQQLGALAVGVAVDVDQDLDAVLDHLLGGLVVGHVGDVDPVFDRVLHALLDRIGRLDAAVVGEDLDLGAIVQLEDLVGEIADGVFAQVRRQIGDAAARRRVVAQPLVRGYIGLRRRAGDVARIGIGVAELQDRIVGVGAEGQRGNPAEQGLAVHLARGRDDRPFALALAQADIVLRDVGLVLVEIEALAQRILGMGIEIAAFKHASDLLQHRRLVLDVLS